MNLWTMAWRNLWRRKRRTLITAVSIGFGVLLAATFTGMAVYMYGNMIDASAATGYGHVTVEPHDYNRSPGLDKRLSDSNALRERILTIPGVETALVRITGQAMFASASKSLGGIFLAIDPATESPRYNILLRTIKQGKLFESADGKGVVIGRKLAEKLKLRPGKKLVYTTTDKNGEIVSEIARVSAIFSTGVNEIDAGLILLPIDRVRQTLLYEPDEATLVAVMLREQRDAAAIREQIESTLGNPQREVLTWRQTQADLAGLITLDSSSNYISQFLVALLIAAGILNTLLMSVLERTREFGVMLAIGMPPARLSRLVMVESFCLAMLGLILGVIITAPWYWYLHTYGIDFSSLLGGEDYSVSGVLVDPIVRIRLHAESITAILSVLFGLALLSGLYPAWRAGRIAPIESLRAI